MSIDLLQVQVRLVVLPGKLLSNTPLMAVKLCLDKECPAKDYLDREYLAMVCLTRAMAKCQEVQVGMAVDKRLKLVDGIRVNLLRATATDTKTTRFSRIRFVQRQIHGVIHYVAPNSQGRRLIGGWAGLECELNVIPPQRLDLRRLFGNRDLDRPEFCLPASIVNCLCIKHGPVFP
jgi:hypothetical protein